MNQALHEPLDLTIEGLPLRFRGGPFRARPDGMVGVCMLPEKHHLKPGDVHVPTRDFTPPPEQQLIEGVEKALRAAIRGETVYVGCTAGIGRTGTFMAAMVKALGITHAPVGFVRAHYHHHAVETLDQEQLIADLDVSHIRQRLWWPIIRRKIALFFGRK